jgi:hypothetical protein
MKAPPPPPARSVDADDALTPAVSDAPATEPEEDPVADMYEPEPEAADPTSMEMGKSVRPASPAPSAPAGVQGETRSTSVALPAVEVVGTGDYASAVRQRAAGLLACYERALRRTPSLQGRVTLRVSSTGGRPSASVVDSDLGDTGLHDCLIAEVRKAELRVPAGGAVGFDQEIRLSRD